MMYYILFYNVIENYAEKRMLYRTEHLALAKEFQGNGQLHLAGALAEPIDGAVLIFKCESEQIVRDFIAKDPYVQNGLVTDWKIRLWTVVIGNV